MTQQITVGDLTELPTVDHITLLFKCHKSTVLLSVVPHRPWSEIKYLLLAALKSRDIETLPGSSLPLPDEGSQLEFGILRDKKDPTKGWSSLDVSDQEIMETKPGKRKGTGKQSMANENPAGAGLTDGGLVAYRLRSETAKSEDEDSMTDILSDAKWDVALPMFEDEVEEEES